GGQRHEGGLTVDAIARQVAAEGVNKLALVTDEPNKYPSDIGFPKGMTIHHRDELDKVQRMLADTPGATAMIYDQTCAAEKRRRRKRGEFPDPDKRVIINELVCEGCGDCGVQSNCVSVQPVETEWGRKRTIDQTSCNKDFSCVKGFCPSFVTVSGAKLKKAAGVAGSMGAQAALPEPKLPDVNGTFGVIITGIGGTGIVTIAQVLGTAAHIEGKAAGIIDMAGLAQKGGAVASHLRIAQHPDDIYAIRVPARGAHLVLGGDIVTVGSKKVLSSMRSGETRVVVNTHETLPGDFTRNADFSLPTERLKREIAKAADADHAHFVDATKLSAALFGSSVTQNMFLVGYAWQLGGLPIGHDAIFRAIELNGESIEMNKQAFEWGRRAAVDPQSVASLAKPAEVSTDARKLSETLDEIIARRERFLAEYQNAAYAKRYRDLVEETRAAEATAMPGQTGLTDAVARYLFKLMAYKDEYEVARLYTNGAFAEQLKATFDGDLKQKVYLAPPLFSRIDPNSGRPKKIEFGGWMFRAFGVLAKFKFLRGTALDLFGYSHERKTERKLVEEYRGLVRQLNKTLNANNHAVAVALAALPEKIRGFGPVKAASLVKAEAEKKALLARFEATTATAAPVQAAAE
ncbi:MAG TPA: indolepyruvate ferredoxin oxidoreductase family protein, partial [Xanthobacteraceae bacterium]|nr:indolepyruvate ferredoxin oxidoreductase family protein [Xanthobacteraceae bacterium]